MQTQLPKLMEGRMFPRVRNQKVAENFRYSYKDIQTARNALRERWWDHGM